MNIKIQTPSEVLIQPETYQRLVESISEYAIYILSEKGIVQSWNAGAQYVEGYTAAEIIGQHFSRLYTPEDQANDKPGEALNIAKESGRFEEESWRVRKDGTRFCAHTIIETIFNSEGKLLGFATIMRDITERRQAQQELRESAEQFRLLVQGVTDYAVYMLSPEGIVTSWNSGAERIKKYKHDEIVGQHFSKFYIDEDRANGLPDKSLAIAASEGRSENEGWRVRKDGTRFWAHVIIDSIRNEKGELIGFAKVTRDITEKVETSKKLKHTEEALFMAQKLEAVGKLTGGVAHDFNNILQIIVGNLQLLQVQFSGDELAVTRLESALSAVERGSKLSSQLLAFARRQPLQPSVVNPIKTIHRMGDLLSRALGESIEIETIIGAGTWNILADPNQLENVILNLAINSRDAMPDGGKLTIEVCNAMLDENYVMAKTDVPPGQYVMIAITDTGSGMPPEVIERACEPFFTTKPEGQGTGLGLSMAYGFVKQSDGHFSIYSEVGSGTTVKMYFPRTFEAETVVLPFSNRSAVGGTETILVVEDDPSVQATAVDMLTNLGYKVFKANNADNALVVLESGVPVDLLFTDVVMPGTLKTPELAKKAKEINPHIEVLYTSGYTQNAIVHGGRLDHGVNLLTKPYGQEQLAYKIKQLLSNRQYIELATNKVTNDHQKIVSSNLKVLVVEDVLESQKITCDMLNVLGYQTRGATDAEDALTLLDKEPFDILITDYSLPKFNGLELANIAKNRHSKLKIIFISGYGEIFEKAPEFKHVVLPKPFDINNLNEALERVKLIDN